MGIFKKEKQEESNVLKLIKRSNNIINIFKKAADDLADVNEDIEVEQDIISAQIKELNMKHESLQITKVDNAKLEQKIRAFLED